MKRKYAIEAAGYICIPIWECEFNKMVEESEEVREFVVSLDIQERLELRDSFYGVCYQLKVYITQFYLINVMVN